MGDSPCVIRCATHTRDSPLNPLSPLAPGSLEQPAADKEEAGQAEKEEHIVECDVTIAQAKVADVGINDEYHRESPHSINISDSLAHSIFETKLSNERILSALDSLKSKCAKSRFFLV